MLILETKLAIAGRHWSEVQIARKDTKMVQTGVPIPILHGILSTNWLKRGFFLYQLGI